MPTRKIRNARLLDSFQAVLRAARRKALSLCIAFVDNKGNTQMMWREREADVGWLNRAEAAAFTAVTENLEDLSLKTLIRSRMQSNEIYHFAENGLSNRPTTGGRPLMLAGHVVGAVAIVGSNQAETDMLLDIAQEAYLAPTVISHKAPTPPPSVPMPETLDQFYLSSNPFVDSKSDT